MVWKRSEHRTPVRTAWRLYRLNRWVPVAGAWMLLTWAAPSEAVTQLTRGSAVASVRITSSDGTEIDLGDAGGAVGVLVFIDTTLAGIDATLASIGSILCDPPLNDVATRWVVVLSKGSDPRALDETVNERPQCRPIVVHDVDRSAFGAFEVIALPSIVVLDRENRVVHAVAGRVPQLDEIIRGAVQLGAGQIDDARFERVLHPVAAPEVSRTIKRAERQMHLGDQLLRQGLEPMAESAYRRAIEIDPRFAPARIRLGTLLIMHDRMEEAAEQFERAVEADPESDEAVLLLASVQLRLGRGDLEEIERAVGAILQRHPENALAHAIMGFLQAQHGNGPEAVASFTMSARLVLGSAADQ